MFVASTPFADAAAEQSQRIGFDARHVLVEHPIQDRTDDEMRAIADATVDALIGALTGAY